METEIYVVLVFPSAHPYFIESAFALKAFSCRDEAIEYMDKGAEWFNSQAPAYVDYGSSCHPLYIEYALTCPLGMRFIRSMHDTSSVRVSVRRFDTEIEANFEMLCINAECQAANVAALETK